MDRWSLLVLVLLGAGLALGCDWDQSVDPDQGLVAVDPAMGLSLDRISQVPDSESCRAKCCARSDCDLVLLRDPPGGPLQCLLVTCLLGDRDVCVLGPATSTSVYRRKGHREAGGKPQNAGDTKHVVPLMSSWEPLSNRTKHQASQDVEAAATARTSEEKETSPADIAELCGAEPQVGPCRAAFEHWYYNSKTGNCQTFIYGGCRGNKNNYVSKESCVATCTVRVLSSVKKEFTDDEVSTEYKDGCMVTSDPGPCRAAFPMFYYDSNSATCQSFLYGGCRGNQNRYNTMSECLSRCSRDGSLEHRGKVREHWTAAVFLFVTLAAISALLLVTLVVITLRRHRRSRLSSISDKEELLPEPDEQSSLESLAVPESPKPDKA